ncbi:hypothetical protein [Histophilus somni]|uniref:hypothetical protein n=1 Tax=Histophilus somni TaxID=731 RepID=UPI00094AAE81|nr:hypothetical protein [Histophilus somni]
MKLSRTEIVAKSDEKNGMQAKSYKLPKTVVKEIENLSQQIEKNRTPKVRCFFKKYLYQY